MTCQCSLFFFVFLKRDTALFLRLCHAYGKCLAFLFLYCSLTLFYFICWVKISLKLIQVLTSMADSQGQISAAVMERLTAAAAAEPYQSVSCAFVSYGSCAIDLAEGWKFRSRLWYGVGLPSATFGGGGSGWESWSSSLEKDENGNWVELPLIKKSVAMLQALLLDESGLGGGLGIGGGSGTGMGGMSALYQLLDSDQPFLCMLRMVLVSMREEDDGETSILKRNVSIEDGSSEGIHQRSGSNSSLDSNARLSIRTPRSALLWR